jgi:CheY-like chemotaxis protein
MSNALAPISLSLELIRETGGIIEGSALGTIQAGAQRATDIIRQLVSLSNTAPESRLLFQPRHLVKETERLIRAAFPKSIQITNSCPKDLWLITADPIQFEEVVLNLSLWAHEAMPGGGCLALSAANVELDTASASRLKEAKPGRFVCLEVRHTGRSISSATQRQTCNPTTSASPRPKKNGAEEGFTTALAIVRGHGGFLTLDREAGQGSVLQAFFPATPDTNACKPSGLAGVQIHGAGQTVLVVDDEPLMRNTVTNVLRRLGFHVLSAADGVEALGLCARHLADLRLLLTDLDLPHMSGLALLRTVRQMNSPIAIMVMAGCCSEEQRTELAALNVTAVLAKPFAQEELLEALRQVFAAQTPAASCLSAGTV